MGATYENLEFICIFFFLASDPLLIPPRREMSRRKAKEKTTIKSFLEKQTLDEEQDADDPDFVDSDTDPVWMPGAKVRHLWSLMAYGLKI